MEETNVYGLVVVIVGILMAGFGLVIEVYPTTWFGLAMAFAISAVLLITNWTEAL